MDDQPKGGTLARQAAMLCELPAFGLYLDQRRRWRQGLSPAQLPDGTHTPEDAADALRQACGIASRAELDHNDQAAAMFRRIVGDFNRWKRRGGFETCLCTEEVQPGGASRAIETHDHHRFAAQPSR